MVIDPETGIVRDINTATGYCGAYCYYDLQSNLALVLGNSLVNGTNNAWNDICDFYTNHEGTLWRDGIAAIDTAGSYYGLYSAFVASTGITASLAFSVMGTIPVAGLLLVD